MKYFFLLASFFLLSSNTVVNKEENNLITKADFPLEETISIEKKIMAFDSYAESIYDCVSNPELNFTMFKQGLKGYYSMKSKGELKDEKYLTLIDFTLPSNKNRFFVIDMESHTIVYESVIAHGRNSGGLIANKFSNESESKMSSLGFFVTGKIYDGKYNHSMKLHGKEYSNDKVYERGVVVHSADYATHDFLKSNGNVLGRSFGCPALPHKGYKEIVNTISNGSCFYIYADDKKHVRNSSYLKARNFADTFYSNFE